MPEMKTLNGYEVVDAKARQDIEDIMGANLASEEYVDEAIAAIPKPDYTGLATEAYVDNAIDNIPEVDLSKHALKSELPTKVSQLQNDSKFITREEVPETDLSAYAKKSEIPDVSDFITSIPSEYITESELNAKGYLTQHQDISGKADKNHTHTEYLTEHQDISHLAPKTSIPTKVSQLANDSNYLTSIPSTYITEAELEAKNYLTEHQSLAAYATKTYVDNTVAENQPNLSGYAKKTDIPDVSDFISEIPSEYVTDSELAAKGYLVEADLSEYAKKSELPEGVDLSEYAKKSEIPTVPTKTSQLTNDSNFLTSIPAEYVTDTELNAKGYLTQHQSLAGYATETYVDDAIAGINIPEGSGKKVLNVRLGYSLTDSEKAIVKEILEYLKTGASDVMSKYEVTLRSPGSAQGTAYLVTGLHDFGTDRLRVYGQVSDNGNMSYFHTDLYSNTHSASVALSCTAFASYDNIVQMRWKQASGLEDSELYSATEIYVLGSDSGELSSCYAYLKTNSGPGSEFGGAQCIPLVSYRGDHSASSVAESNMPYIDWQGWGFEAHNFSVVAVFYK